MNKAVVERVQKLLALAESTNQHEADLAMERAHALMKEHNLTMSQVERKNESEIQFVFHRQANGKKHDWDHILSLELARVFLCELVIPKSVEGDLLKDYVIIGKETNVAIFKEMYNYAYKFIGEQYETFVEDNWMGARKGQEYLDMKKSFECGIASGMIQKLRIMQWERTKDVQKSKEHNDFALVVSDEVMNNHQAMLDKFKDVVPYEGKSEELQPDDYFEGLEASKGADFGAKKFNK